MRLRSLALLFLASALLAWWTWPSSKSAPVDELQLSVDRGDLRPLVNRIWIDKIPTRERDKVQVFLMLDEPTVGIFSTSSAYEGAWTAFEWSQEGGLRFLMLQENKSYSVTATIMRGANCLPFDYCLRLKGPPLAAKKYGSMEDWVVTDGETNPHELITRLFFRE